MSTSSTPTPVPILVLGAGELGLRILQALASHPNHASTITVLLRPPPPPNSTNPTPKNQALIQHLETLNISTLTADITTASTHDLATLFSPFHTIIGCTGMYNHPAGTQLKLARAVLLARTFTAAALVRRYIPWQFGLDYDAIGRGSSQDLFTEQLDVRDLLRAQTDVAWTVVSTGLFTSFLFEPSFGVVSEDRRTVRALGSWENEVTVTAPGDIGIVVADIVYADPEPAAAAEAQGVVFTAGETISFSRLADVVEGVWGRKVRREEWGLGFLRGELERDSGDGMRKYRVVVAEGKGVAWSEAGSWDKKRGLRLMGVEEWVRGNLM